MKKVKLITIWIFTFIMLTNLFYVPWLFICKHEENRDTVRQAGYSFIFSSPVVPGSSYSGYSSKYKKYDGFSTEYWSVQVDRYKITAQTVAIIILFGAVFFTINAVKNKRE